MYQARRVALRRRLMVVAAALALIGVAAPAATAKVAARPSHATKPQAGEPKAVKPKPAPRVPKPKAKAVPRTGLLVSVCKISHRLTDDPIIYPNLPGVSHSHDFYGNDTTNASSTPASLHGQTTSCSIAGDTAAYWAPTLLVNGAAVRPTAMLAYYTVFGAAPVTPLPIGLEMVAKDPNHVKFTCFTHSMPTAAYTKMPTCKPGQLMSIGVTFPSCWNGTDLTSADGRSHMAYPDHNVCPAAFPVLLPKLSMWLTYNSVPRGSVITLSSGSLATAHADYINAWDSSTFLTLERFCLVEHRECYKEMPRVLQKLHLKRQQLKLMAGLGDSAPDAPDA